MITNRQRRCLTMNKRNRNHHPNKIPPFHPDPEHWTRKSSHGWKAKVAYETEDDACEFLQLHPKIVAAGYVAYPCNVCSKWHIGHKKTKDKKI